MQRFLMADLLEWKDSPHRKPLVLNGARQVGKTWLLQELGKTAFKNVAYVSFDNNPQLASLFDNGYDLAQILLGIQADYFRFSAAPISYRATRDFNTGRIASDPTISS